MKKEINNILTIRGEGQNVGKTLLACDIISKFSRQHEIIALKISPHKHANTGNAKLVWTLNNSSLLEETNYKSQKDTGRMLAAGAVKSYLLQTTDEEFGSSLESFFELVGKDSLVVCESGKISSHVVPGISFFVRQLNCQVYEIEKKITNIETERVVSFAVNGFDVDLNSIEINNGNWILRN